ncbi:MAG TPA: efflux RND transporter permease subunit [Steroidobacteraceae bacterium]|jgi:multidrug efflux pump subunit AcrB
MWIVEVALRRPYTFIVMALLILLATPLVLLKMSVDIFPEINIPVISIVWNYQGLSAQEVGLRITAVNERSLTTVVNDIEHIESTSLNGMAVIKVFFQPNANIPTAIAQIVATEQQQLRNLPPGALPPLVIKYSASAIPVIQLGLSSPTLTEPAVFDAAVNFLRPRLVTIPGVAIPWPYGGKQRVISVDIDTPALLAKGLTPNDVLSAVNAQNLILPSGTAKIGGTEFPIELNGSPDSIAALNRIPVSNKNGVVTYLSEVAHVRDGFVPQVSIVRQNGERGVLMSIIKNGGSSTLDIVKSLLDMLPEVSQILPKDLKIAPLFDQSGFVRAAISGVVKEAVVAACLTAALILVFLGNWRSTCIIAVSIPLSILTSIIALYICGETLNIMTLGGLALAVGILVDDATVTIENIERHIHLGSDMHKAILDGAGEIALPALVSTLCICIVFVPMFFLTGVARYLFAPLAEAVVFAMLASYVLSRTLVPTLVMLLMDHTATPGQGSSLLQRIYQSFNARFEKVRGAYTALLSAVLLHRRRFAAMFLGFCVLSCCLVFVMGRDFFPGVDAGQIRMHMRLPSGTRIEETAREADKVEASIRRIIPPQELGVLLDNLGPPISSINNSYSNSGTFSTLDGEIQISLKNGHRPTVEYIEAMRRALPKQFPGDEFFFQPADMVTQILNFGLPAAIDVLFSGANLRKDYELAAEAMKRIRAIPGVVDAHIHQRLDLPTLSLKMDRTQLQLLGLSANDVAENLLISTAGTTQTSPGFWLDPSNGVIYNLEAQAPQYDIDSIDALLRTPVRSLNGPAGSAPQLLSNLVTVQPSAQSAVMSRFNLAPAIDVYVGVQGRDLGSITTKIKDVVNDMEPHLPRGTTMTLRGQAQTMRSSFLELGLGLVMAVVLVYLLIVVNFQSWVDAFIIITALPAALAGICWMLLLTATNLSVPALTGAIMTMGVATANSILIVSFARQRMDEGLDPLSAALDAGATRIRPVLMTASAMIIGMIPMALGWGEGAEQNAPLGRAVIGGLLFATISTLLFVPVIFAGVHRRLEARKLARGAAPQLEGT